MTHTVLLLNGPNLNRLGRRNPAVYGTKTLPEVEEAAAHHASLRGARLDHVQSNSQGTLLDWLHERQDEAHAVVINPAGLTSTGDALRDALLDAALPLAVVHLSNLHARPDPWRRSDIFAPVADIYIAGGGWHGYLWAIEALLEQIAATELADRPPAPST